MHHPHTVPPDHCRVEALISGRPMSRDIPVTGIEDAMISFEAMLDDDDDPGHVAARRGTHEGQELVACVTSDMALAGMQHQVAMAILWLHAHGADCCGWDALSDLGGRTVRAVALPGTSRLTIQVSEPARRQR